MHLLKILPVSGQRWAEVRGGQEGGVRSRRSWGSRIWETNRQEPVGGQRLLTAVSCFGVPSAPTLTTVIPAAASRDAPSPPRTRVTALPWVAKAASGGKFIPGFRTGVTREAAGTCDQQPGRQVPGYLTPELGKKPLSDMNHWCFLYSGSNFGGI